MMMLKRKSMLGVTLVEMLLVLVIISIIIYSSITYMQQRAMQMRIERTATQMQQILNAGLAFYVNTGAWPNNLSDLQSGGYLPPSTVTLNNPWGNTYTIVNGGKLLYVYTGVKVATSGSASGIAQIIAGSLPLAYTSTDTSGSPPTAASCGTTANTCTVVASVNIPGQNLNNASAVNFAGLYKHGGCVPVPTCPTSTSGLAMTAQIMVVPSSVTGLNVDTSSGTPPVPGSTSNVYPISSFSAYATGDGTSNAPPACKGATIAPACPSVSGVNYWRACLQVTTEIGTVSSTETTGPNAWGQYVQLMAVTRCAPTNEPAGSPFTVFSN